MAEGDALIIHLVAWSYRDDVPASERVTVTAGIARGREIAEARAFALSENGSPVRTDGFTHAYLATFDDRDALAAFQRDPRHAPFSPRMVEATAQLMVLDLECRADDAPAPGRRGLRHCVVWSFKEGTTADDEREVVDGLYAARVVPPTQSLAVGKCLGLSQRTFGKTHMQVTTYDDFAGLELFRADTALHAPSGLRLQKHTGGTTVIDVLD